MTLRKTGNPGMDYPEAHAKLQENRRLQHKRLAKMGKNVQAQSHKDAAPVKACMGSKRGYN